MTELATKWYTELIEDLSGRLTEGFFNSRWELIETYHYLGRRILDDNDNFQRAGYGKKIFAEIRKSLEDVGIKTSESSIYRAVQFARKYPSLETLKEGKNISWSKICQKYLPLPKDMQEEEDKNEVDAMIDRGIKMIEKLPDKFTGDIVLEILKAWEDRIKWLKGEIKK